jgi:uncharacterized protein
MTLTRCAMKTLIFSFLLSFLSISLVAQPPAWNIQREVVKIPMRDGVNLEAILYKPAGEGRFPAIVYRTPYGKDEYDGYAMFPLAAAKEGFAVFLVDVRGRFGSEGEFKAYHQERPDGYDLIEWVGKQPYVNGRVGTYGGSYPGIVQWLALSEAPEALKAAAPDMTPINSHYFYYFGGAFSLVWLDWFMPFIVPDLRKRANDASGPWLDSEAYDDWVKERESWYKNRPLSGMPLLKKYAPYYYDWLSHPDKSDWWDFVSVEKDFEKMQAPALLLSGWYDAAYGPLGAIQAFQEMKTKAATPLARENTTLILGPWNHTSVTVRKTNFGEVSFGPSAGFDFDRVLIDWFTIHLKEEEASMPDAVSVFVMGANEWKTFSDWPVPDIETTTFYLDAGADNKSGKLMVQPSKKTKNLAYTFDPNNPLYDKSFEKSYPYDQREIESREDVLVFTSDVLTQDIEVIGLVEAALAVSSSARDTDFHVVLCDVYPDGTSINLSGLDAGYLRMRYREGLEKQVLMEPEKVYRISIDNTATANLFKAGHRIRLYVTSSSFPHYDPNPNTGTNIATEVNLIPAVNKVHVGGKNASKLILPTVKN